MESLYGGVTHDLVGLFQDQHQLESTGAVDERTADALNRLLVAHSALDDEARPYNVKGTVRLADGFPADGVTVSVFDRDLRFDQPLGDYKTDKTGYYQIGYSARQFRKGERGSADLVVKAFGANGSLLGVSQVLFNAPSYAEIDLKISAERWQPPTLFEKIRAAAEPLLEGLKVSELEEDKEDQDLSEEDNRHQDLSFLSGETGFEKTNTRPLRYSA